MSVIKSTDLSGRQADDLKTIQDKWLSTVFVPLRDKNGFRQDCKDCGDIFWDLELSIGADGKVEQLTVQRSEMDCPHKSDEAKKALETAMLNGLRDMVFPASLHKLVLDCRFGKTTRC